MLQATCKKFYYCFSLCLPECFHSTKNKRLLFLWLDMNFQLKRIATATATFGTGLYLGSWLMGNDKNQVYAEARKSSRSKRALPSRKDHIHSLQNEKFDILIIGGGATGAGCALDSASRGLKTALVEADDFASGSSSRSGKIIHGGLRYLQKAILHFDLEQYRMVKEALNERFNMMQQAPYLTKPQPFMIPVYHWWEVPYYWIGVKAYDLVAGSKKLKKSFYLNKKETLEIYPILKEKGLYGSLVYYDGQQDDARMCLAIILTAARQGATVANHVKCLSLNKDDQGILSGARLKDEITGKEWNVTAKCIINATGPFTDAVRKMDDSNVTELCHPSSGIHIILPGFYSPQNMGILVNKTKDSGLSAYWCLYPWKNRTIVGTTDVPTKVTNNPKPTEEEVLYLLQEVTSYVNPNIKVKRGDVLSAWCGIRPLIADPNRGDTQSLIRNHVIFVSPSKLITISGGKWTTYRLMAEQAVDTAIQACDLKPVHERTRTKDLVLEGTHEWTPVSYFTLIQDFGLESIVAKHLVETYGDKAVEVAKLARSTGRSWPIVGKKLHHHFPYIEAEIRYGVKEYAVTAIDMIARRLRLAFLNAQIAQEVLPRVINIMSEELSWSEEEKKVQLKKATEFLQEEMGLFLNKKSRDKTPILLSKDEIKLQIKRFSIIDKEHKGFITVNDLRKGIKSLNVHLADEDLKAFLDEVAIMYNTVYLEDFIQIMSSVKTGHILPISPKDKEVLRKQVYAELSELSLEM